MSRSAPIAPPAAPVPGQRPAATLAELRAEIDRLDDAIHDLLMARAEVVARVGAEGGKGRVALRPGREADILRRLLARNRGKFPAGAVVRVWRELLAATTSIQGPYVIAIFEAEPGSGFAQCAREHFGALTPLRVHRHAAQAIAEVSAGTATVAVLPMPADGEPSPWWPGLMDSAVQTASELPPHHAPRLHVVARLPFWAPRSEGAPDVQALVVAAVAPDASAADRSLMALALPAGQSRTDLAAALEAAGFAPGAIVLHDGRHEGSTCLALADVAGAVATDDPRLAMLAGTLRPPVVLGAYAVPLEGKAV